MRHRLLYSIALVTFSLYTTHIFTLTYIKNSFQKAYQWIKPKKAQQEVVQKEFPIANNGTFSLKNINGPITIQTEWNQNCISMKAIKKGQKIEHLQDIDLIHSQTANSVTIRTIQKDPKSTATMAYHITVPVNVTVHVSTQVGDITIAHVHGAITATTDKGNITIQQTHNSAIAHTNQMGNITIAHAHANVQAVANKGSIHVSDAHASILAETHLGGIEVFSSKVPATGSIKLSTRSGDIKLHIPPGSNADLSAHTEKGIILCSHEITLKPRTLTLETKNSWRKLSKQVEGILGSGEAQIVLNSDKSNIKILQTTLS